MLQNNGVLIQRVSRQVDAHQLSFLVQSLQIIPTGSQRNFGSGYVYHIISAEKRISSCCFVNLVTVPVTNQRFNKHFSPAIQSKELLALYLREIIKTTRQSQRFYVLLIAGIEVNALYKIEYSLERAVSSAFFNNTLHRTFANSLDSSQSETYVPHLIYRKLQITLIDIRS